MLGETDIMGPNCQNSSISTTCFISQVTMANCSVLTQRTFLWSEFCFQSVTENAMICFYCTIMWYIINSVSLTYILLCSSHGYTNGHPSVFSDPFEHFIVSLFLSKRMTPIDSYAVVLFKLGCTHHLPAAMTTESHVRKV